MASESDERVWVALTRDEALVLFEWLTREDNKGALPTVDKSERIAIWRVLGQLESTLVEPFHPDYVAMVAEARARIIASE